VLLDAKRRILPWRQLKNQRNLKENSFKNQ
jgi:hypothetical protein